MRYLFLDIECADGGKGTICSVGYVLTDESFKIIRREDIIINPESRFYLVGRADRPDIELAYPIERFKMAPKFSAFHAKIKALVEAEDTIVVGHAVSGDVVFLNKACARYHLEPFTYRFFDTQRMYSDIFDDKKHISLENALLKLGVNERFRAHQSIEDARASMLLLKALLEKCNKSFDEYCAGSNYATGSTAGGRWEWDQKPTPEEVERRLHRGEGENGMRPGRANHKIFLRYLEHGEALGERSGKLEGKRITISLNYESEHFKEMISLAGMIKAAGGEYVLKASSSDMFVTSDEVGEDGEKRHCSRSEYVMAEIAEGKEIKVITLDDLFAILGITREELESMTAPDTEYLRDEKYGVPLTV